MSQGINSAASSMQANGRRVEIIADNLANLSTTGYKRRVTSVGMFAEQVRGATQQVMRTQTRFDFGQGVLVRNSEPYNLALFGDGFFAVEGKEGEVYTRNGNFHVGEDGVLKTAEDLPVAWESRGGTIDPHGVPVVVGPDGSVIQGTDRLGRLRVVDFENKHALTMHEGGYFSAPKGLRAEPAQAQVHQGALESSNASAVGEVIQLIEAQRAYEIASTVMTQNDQSYRRLTRQV